MVNGKKGKEFFVIYNCALNLKTFHPFYKDTPMIKKDCRILSNLYIYLIGQSLFSL